MVTHVHRPMMIGQVFAAPGDDLEVHFPEGSSRGSDYVMTLHSGSALPFAFQLSPVLAGREGTPSWRPIQDRLPVADMAFGAIGPDRVVVPETAIPGIYSICIENMPEPLCDVVTVTE